MTRWTAVVLLGLSSLTLVACTSHVDHDEASPQPWPEEVFPTPPVSTLTDAKPAAATTETRACPRRGGSLEVLCTTTPVEEPRGRLRSHARGCLGVDCQRLWTGPTVPSFVALTMGTQELTLLDKAGEEFMAMYRDPYGASSCSLADESNCEFHVRVYDHEGAVVHELRLNDYISRGDHIEVQDVHYEDGVVYFNEACQSYSREAGGRCSALVAVDARAGEKKWRTKHRVSNGYFALLEDYVAVSYGFTSETPSLSLVHKHSGKVAWTTKPPGAADYMVRVDGATVFTRRYDGRPETFVVRQGQLVLGRSRTPRMDPI